MHTEFPPNSVQTTDVRPLQHQPKSMEKRIRRAAAGMVNLANPGIENYRDDTFADYARTMYHFE